MLNKQLPLSGLRSRQNYTRSAHLIIILNVTQTANIPPKKSLCAGAAKTLLEYVAHILGPSAFRKNPAKLVESLVLLAYFPEHTHNFLP